MSVTCEMRANTDAPIGHEQAGSALVHGFYGRVLAGDAAGAIRECVAPDFVWENPLPKSIPFAGAFRGAAGAACYLELIFSHLDLEHFEIDDVLMSGSTVVILGRETVRVKATNRRYTQQWVHVVKLRDGLITKIREYNDCAAILQAFA